jgi:hypothetical protein
MLYKFLLLQEGQAGVTHKAGAVVRVVYTQQHLI